MDLKCIFRLAFFSFSVQGSFSIEDQECEQIETTSEESKQNKRLKRSKVVDFPASAEFSKDQVNQWFIYFFVQESAQINYTIFT